MKSLKKYSLVLLMFFSTLTLGQEKTLLEELDPGYQEDKKVQEQKPVKPSLLMPVVKKEVPQKTNDHLTFFYPATDPITNQAKERVFGLDAIKKGLFSKGVKSKAVTYFDPIYRKPKTFLAFLLTDILDLAYGSTWQRSVFSDVEFTSKSGNVTSAKTFILGDGTAYVAFKDQDHLNWEKFPSSSEKTAQTPAPYYLFWIGADNQLMEDHPWFWGIESIKLVKFEDRYPLVVPSAVEKDSAEYRGFEVFRSQCIRCHAINRQGGKIGPDLNEPKSIVQYRDISLLKKFIYQASSFRYSNMPDFTHLSESDLNDLVAFFSYKNKNRM